MAVWQYTLTAIPEKGIIKKYGKVPQRLFESHKVLKTLPISENVLQITDKLTFQDIRKIKWWNETKIDLNLISAQIDKLETRGSWSNNVDFFGWKGDTNNGKDNDCHISFDKDSLIVNEFHFRTDIRSRNNVSHFLSGMLVICKENDLLVMNSKGLLLKPDIEIILEDIKKSNAVDFLTDPKQFLDKIIEEDKKANFWSKIKVWLS